ncbi:MAG: acetolactate synthase large subunit, partial [Bacteroidia bacterium]|nr:acetolactate synthase large subunit [Bacteroidia bacterium]
YAPNAKIIHIDIDKAEFNKNIRVDLPLCGDAREILRKIIPNVEFRSREEWFSYIDQKWEKERRVIIDDLMRPGKSDDGISMARAVDCVARVAKGEAIVVTDVGQNQMFGARYSKFRKTRSFITSGGLGTMGYGLPAAIGAKVGMPDKEVVLILGDGGFQMSIQELGTILQSGIKIKILLLNNSYLGMVRQWQQLFFDRRYSYTDMVNPDFMKIAQAYNIPSIKVEHQSELEKGVREMIASDSPFLLEVVVEKEENVFPMVPNGASLDETIYNANK